MVAKNIALLFLALISGGTALACAQNDIQDRSFDRVPFDKWVAGNERGTIRIGVNTLPRQAILTHHQRLKVTVFGIVDGKEVVKRPAEGKLVFYLQITDRAGHIYRTHTSIPLRDADKETRRANLEYAQGIFVTPGDYRLDIAVVHTATGDHGINHKTLHVDPLSDDPLAAAASDLPPVEFVEESSVPDKWFQPTLKGHLNLSLPTTRPVRVEVLVNASQSEVSAASSRLQDMTMSGLIPALKTLGQINIRNGATNLTLLDLERRRVLFHQDNAHGLDWPALREALGSNDPNVIDVQALADRRKIADFFLTQVGQRVESTAPGDPFLVLIILSPPMTLSKDVALHPIQMSEAPNTLIFYVRYGFPSRGMGRAGSPPMIGRGGRPGMIEPMDIPMPRPSLADDDLERTLKPLKPRLFDVSFPMDFRRALSTMLSTITRAAQ